MTHKLDKLAKKDLTRQYKQTLPLAGVYAIRNQTNQRVLVGASMRLDGALNRHRTELRLQTHRNAALLQDWYAHGAGRFTFDILDTVTNREDPDFDYQAELATMFDLWCEELRCFDDNGYNIRPASARSRIIQETP